MDENVSFMYENVSFMDKNVSVMNENVSFMDENVSVMHENVLFMDENVSINADLWMNIAAGQAQAVHQQGLARRPGRRVGT